MSALLQQIAEVEQQITAARAAANRPEVRRLQQQLDALWDLRRRSLAGRRTSGAWVDADPAVFRRPTR